MFNFVKQVTCCVLSGSVLSDSATPWTVACQAPLSMERSRQEYCSVLPVPPPGDLPYPRMEPTSPALASGFLTTEPPGKPKQLLNNVICQKISEYCFPMCLSTIGRHSPFFEILYPPYKFGFVHTWLTTHFFCVEYEGLTKLFSCQMRFRYDSIYTPAEIWAVQIQI